MKNTVKLVLIPAAVFLTAVLVVNLGYQNAFRGWGKTIGEKDAKKPPAEPTAANTAAKKGESTPVSTEQPQSKPETEAMTKTKEDAQPSTGEETSAKEDTKPTAPSQAVNINTASKEALVALPGIGEVIAQRIIDYRTAHGPFKTTEDLVDVKGIGEKIMAELKGLITV